MPTTARPWKIRPPDIPDSVAALETAPRIDPADPVLREVRLRGVRLTPPEPLPDLELRDVELDGCDVAGLVSDGGRVASVRLTQTRLRGVTWVRGFFDDLLLEDVTGSEVSLRFSTLRRTVFRDVSLAGLDLTEVEFDRVRFERCDLRGATFAHARVTQLRIEGCDLAGARGLESLRGASLHPDDVMTAAFSLATSLGIDVSED